MQRDPDMVTLEGRLWVPKQQQQAVQRALTRHIELTREEPGCTHFAVTPSAHDPLCLMVSEAFVDDQAFAAHQVRTGTSAWGNLTQGCRRHYRISGQTVGADVNHMHRALELAEAAAQAGEVPVGAVLVRDNVVLGEGANTPVSAHDPSAHAEVVALRAAALSAQNYRLPGTVLYVTIEPCLMCVGALIHARVGRVVFGAREGKAGALASNPVLEHHPANHQIDVVEGILEETCAQHMTAFFANRR